MFTGLVTHRGVVRRLTRQRYGLRLLVQVPTPVARLRVGGSLAVNGACLSVAARRGRVLAFDLVPETVRRTTCGRLRAGDRVHLELPLRAGAALHGHVVTGHVDGVGRVRAVGRRGRERWLDIALPAAVRRYCLPKGSLAVDGVSLTVGALRNGRARIYLIPLTLRRTLLGARQPGDGVNLEADALIKAALVRRRTAR